MAGDVVRNYKIRYSVDDKATPEIVNLGRALTALSTASDRSVQRIKPLNDSLGWLAQGAEVAEVAVVALNAALIGTPNIKGKLDAISSGLGRVDFNAGTAVKSVSGLNHAFGSLGAHTAAFGNLQAAVQKTQRSTYGLMKNAEGASAALGRIVASAAAIEAMALSIKGMGAGLKTVESAGKSTDSAFGNLFARMIGFQVVNKVIDAVGDSIRKAREDTIGWAEDALKLRDELRELANLKGKPGADDSVVGDQLRLRVETGMTGPEARKFQEQFLGSLPLAKDAGGIDDKTAADLSGQIGRLATRTGLEGGTAGDLAGVMGMFGKIPDAKVGLGQGQQIVDLLNDGRGNLTPLAKALVKGAASTVGKGKAFGSLAERAAAISVASGIGDKNATDTTVGAAIRALSGGGSKAKQATLDSLGIGGQQSFMERLDRLAPLFEKAEKEGKSKNDALLDAGFGNLVDRRALIGFFENRETLRKRLNSVKEDDPNDPFAKARKAGERSARLNDQFYSTDKAARNRVAIAKLDRAKNQRGQEGEDLQIARREAEAKLLRERKIDTPLTNLEDAFRGGFGLQEKIGGQSPRDDRIDQEVIRQANEEATKRGFKPVFSFGPFSKQGAKEAAAYLRRLKENDAKKVKVQGGQPLPGNQQIAPIAANAPPDQAGDAGGGGVGRGGAAAVGLNGPGALEKLTEILRTLQRMADQGKTPVLPLPRPALPLR